MTDPFSISGGVVGVVSLGITVCQGFQRYYGPWKSFDDEIQGFTAKLEGLLDTLRVLEGFLSPENELELPSESYKNLVSRHLKACQKACSRLEEMLEKCKSSDTSAPFVRKHDCLRLKRAVYPFKKETLTSLSQIVSDLQDNLSLGLQLLQSALMSQQQTQILNLISRTSSIDVRTTRILDVVESTSASVSYQALIQQTSCLSRAASSATVEPSTLRDLCNQQRVVESCWRRKRIMRLSGSPIDLISRYCTCRRKPRFLSMFGFSVFTLHEASCPLYVDRQQAIGVAGSYTFCNRFLGLSIRVMMTLTKGAGAFGVSPAIQVHAVVSEEAPAFKLLREVQNAGWDGRNILRVMEDTKTRVLQLLAKRDKAAPTDRLSDGRTLLHYLGDIMWAQSRWGRDPRCHLSLRALVQALIEAGVPIEEVTVHGRTVLDTWIWTSSIVQAGDIAAGLLQDLLKAGSCIGSLKQHDDDLHRVYITQLVEFIRLLLQASDIDEFEFTQIERAILTRSEEALRRCLHFFPEAASPSPDTLLCMCVGWPAGLMIILESSLSLSHESISDCFVMACNREEIESASILLQHVDGGGPFSLTAAVRSRSTGLLQGTISKLASSRQKLQESALYNLPSQTVRSLGLPTHALLDTRAWSVYTALRAQTPKEMPTSYSDRGSVYGYIACNRAAAELLYEAGFNNLNQCDEDGRTPLMWLQSFGEDELRNFASFAHWMVSKGAKLHQKSKSGYPAVYYLAETFGESYETCLHGRLISVFNSTCPDITIQTVKRELRSLIESQPIDGARLLSSLLTDEFRDHCECACSEGGCSSLTRLLRGFWRTWFGRMHIKMIGPAMIDELQMVAYDFLTDDDRTMIAYDTIRYLTFEALELTHTCHALIRDGESQLSRDEIDELREEESLLIAQLEELVLEFKQQYDQLKIGIYEFLEAYWDLRMKEVLAPAAMDPEERRRVEEIGVVLSDDPESEAEPEEVGEWSTQGSGDQP
ncbi:uncharacterized protein BJX67DRAFT_385786 [Aspergillus lucknowensis]|uniref:Fungal N-terminal domain-containing protein n=1 Tax=Aspergillus lucknowensis TaxID=176173 RepID=A0ABR4LCN0_9EURO